METPANDKPQLDRGLLLVLSAPSGAGKTTLARRLLADSPDAVFSVSYTTRQPRGKEKDGVDYHFVDVQSFQDKIERGEFVEWAEVHGHFYGSSRSVVEQARAKNGIAVFDIDVQGGQAIKRKYPEAVLVFILPPSMEELERRLRDRKTDSEETIRKRMLVARSEMERGIASYDYIIVNDDFDRAYSELRSVVVAERCRRGRVDLGRLHLDPAPDGKPSAAPGG
ncbi:MAG: guanylate kinase [Myxococcaceae bacterium]|nr:guanylate kinase [Myxococcaceae bacterium]